MRSLLGRFIVCLSLVVITGLLLSDPCPLSASAPYATGASFQARVFPNPWKVDRDSSLGITFDQFPSGSTVKIFTVAAEEVRVLQTNGTGVTWDLKNDDGDNVASGVYLYLVQSPSDETVRGKVVIIR